MFCFVEEIVSYTHRAGDNVLPHAHGGYEVIVYRNGSGIATTGGEELLYSENSLLIVPKMSEHFERTVSQTDVRSCVFHTDYFDLSEPVMIKNEKLAPQIDKVYALLGKMMKIYIGPEKDEKKLDGYLAQVLYILTYVYDAYKSNFNSQTVAICDNAKKYIRANFNKNIRFEILAENIGYSYDRFRHIFVEVVGMGPKAYQQGIRMSKAKKMLASTGKSVTGIAAECGYVNPVCFMNYFKRTMKMTPLQYRKISRAKIANKTFNLEIFDS